MAGTDVDGDEAACGNCFQECSRFGGYRHWRQVWFAGVFEGSLVDNLEEGEVFFGFVRIGAHGDEVVEEAFVVWVEMPYFVAGVDEQRLDKKMGGWVVFGVEENIKFFGKDLFDVALHLSFGMVDCGDVGVGTEKVEDDAAERDDVYGEVGVLSAEGADKGSEHNAVAVALSSKNDDAFWFFFNGQR